MGPCVSRIVFVLNFLGHDLYALYSLPMSGLGFLEIYYLVHLTSIIDFIEKSCHNPCSRDSLARWTKSNSIYDYSQSKSNAISFDSRTNLEFTLYLVATF